MRGSALVRRLALEGAPLVRASPTSPSPHLLSPSPGPHLLSPYLATEAAIRATAMEVVATGMTVRVAAAEAVEAKVGQVLPAKS